MQGLSSNFSTAKQKQTNNVNKVMGRSEVSGWWLPQQLGPGQRWLRQWRVRNSSTDLF
jgi:hypothetical protein